MTDIEQLLHKINDFESRDLDEEEKTELCNLYRQAIDLLFEAGDSRYLDLFNKSASLLQRKPLENRLSKAYSWLEDSESHSKTPMNLLFSQLESELKSRNEILVHLEEESDNTSILAGRTQSRLKKAILGTSNLCLFFTILLLTTILLFLIKYS